MLSWEPSLHHCFSKIVALSLLNSATDALAWKTRKGATKCDMHCELQNSVSQWILDRALRSWDIPKGMPASASLVTCFACAHCLVHAAAMEAVLVC